jgi:uncharacterized membrane protein YqjE
VASSTERPGGIVGSARRIVAHGAALLRLERELAKAELERKAGTLGAGVFTVLAAALLAVFAIGFGLATLTAVLALVVDWWLALLIVFVFLVLVVVGLAFASRSLFRAGTPLKPEQAIEEAQRTAEALRGARGD